MGSVDEVTSAVGVVYSGIEEIIEASSRGPDGAREGDKRLLTARDELGVVLERLFDIGAILARGMAGVGTAGGGDGTADIDDIALPRGTVRDLERQIDDMTRGLPELENFILPIGGGVQGSYCHLARSIARRAERDYVRYRSGIMAGGGEGGGAGDGHRRGGRNDEPTTTTVADDDDVGRYLNRLSDYLFQLARVVTEERNRVWGRGEGEVKFKKGKKGRREKTK